MQRCNGLVAGGAALPLNPQGVRSFAATALGYFDVLARSYDPVLSGAVGPARESGETWVAFDARMQRLAVATLAASPLFYLAGSSARRAGPRGGSWCSTPPSS